MATQLRHMTGEELLLTSILGDTQVRDDVDRELDRRALTPPSALQRPRRSATSRWRAASRVA